MESVKDIESKGSLGMIEGSRKPQQVDVNDDFVLVSGLETTTRTDDFRPDLAPLSAMSVANFKVTLVESSRQPNKTM